MLTLAWVELQIEAALNGKNEPQNVRDYALLCIARDNLKAAQPAPASTAPEKPQRVVLADYSADLTKVPRLEQIDAAISAAASQAYAPEERQHVRDQKTWAEILKS